MTVQCPEGHVWTVETERVGGTLLTRPGAVRYVSRGELETLTAPGLEGLRKWRPGVFTVSEFVGVER